MKAVLCPVCNGKGKLGPQEDFSDYYERPCHGCAGWGSKGWLLIPEQENLPMPYGGGNDTLSPDATDVSEDITNADVPFTLTLEHYTV